PDRFCHSNARPRSCMNRDEFALKVLIADANEIVAGSRKRRWVWVRHSSRSQKRDLMLACDGCNERIEPFLEFGRDEILSIFGALDRVDVILRIGMAHVPQAATRKITGLVPRLRRSDHPAGFPSPSGL